MQKKRVSLQRQAAVTVEAAEDCAWRFESGVNEVSFLYQLRLLVFVVDDIKNWFCLFPCTAFL